MIEATFTIGAEAANARNVLVQLGSRTTRGAADLRNSKSKRAVDMYLSSDAAGDVVVSAATTGIVPTDGGAGVLLDAPEATTPIWRMKTDADGAVAVLLTNSGDEDETVHLNVVDPTTGKVRTSAAIAFVDDTP